MHEAGRAFDLDLDVIKNSGISLQEFWEIANKYGILQIISTPDFGKDEAWHFGYSDAVPGGQLVKISLPPIVKLKGYGLRVSYGCYIAGRSHP